MSKFRIACFLIACWMLLCAVSCDGDVPEASTTIPTTEITTTESNLPPEEPPVVKMLPSQDLQIISINLWNNETIQARAERMIEVLNSYHADSIGVQECGQVWVDLLEDGIGDRYARVGVDTNGLESGANANYVYYLKDKYNVVADGTFWLSPTPDVPSAFGSTVSSRRACTWVVLEHIETGFRYVHMNAHLECVDTNVTVVQAQMVRNQMLRFEAMGYPVFATGDFNALQGLVAYEQMLVNDRISDSKKVAADTMDVPTHVNGTVIDYCFVTGNQMDVLKYRVLHEETISDHKAVIVDATVHALPEQKGNDTIPSFAADATVKVQSNGSENDNLSLSFPQARGADGSLAVSYRLRLLDQSGEVILQQTVGAKSFCEMTPETISVCLSGGVPTQRYVIELTPISLFGKEGAPIRHTFVWSGDPIDQNVLPTPDLLDLIVQENTVLDRSENGYEISSVGDVVIENDRIAFHNNGIVKVVGINEKFNQMGDGFTMEVVLTTEDDVTSFQGLVSCKHSGGFGFFINNGVFTFEIHGDNGYVSTFAVAKPNTTYHLIGVFDGDCVRLYSNGVLVHTSELSGAMKHPTNVNAAYLAIGGDSNSTGTGEHFGSGSVSYVGLYSDALHEVYITQLTQRAQSQFPHKNVPDLLDLTVQGNVLTDNSAYHYEISKVGDILVADDKISFDKNGIVKVVDLNGQFDKMKDGFTLEVVLTTGSDIGFQGLVSCKHSGGFGLFISGKKFTFDVHNEDGYVCAPVEVQANTTYHLVGVFEGDRLLLYVNGELAYSCDFPGTMKYPTNPAAAYLSIGGDSNAAGTGEHFGNGSVSYVGLYSAALRDPAEIAQLAADKLGA